MIDDAPLALGSCRAQGFGNDIVQSGRVTLDTGSQRIATEGAESYFAYLRRFAGFERQPIIIDQDPLVETLYDRSIFCEIEGHDRNVLQADVLPNVPLGPIRERKNPDRLAGD